MYKLRDRLRNFVLRINLDWKIKFVIFATILAMLEEVVTTIMTNTAPLYGVSMTQAHITASANYWDVVLTHSVILLVFEFVIWTWILSEFGLSANQVFLLYGLTGTIMEMAGGGFGHVTEIGMTMFVYGLMVYLPAYSIPPDRRVRKPRFWHYPLFVIVPLLGVIPGGIASTIIKHMRPPHYFPGVK